MKSKKTVRFISLLLGMLMMMTVLPICASAETTTNIATVVPTKATAGATFRLGVVSDSHLDGEAAEPKLTAKNINKALLTMQELGVDALAMNGDMVYAPQGAVPSNLYSALKGFIETNGTFTLAGEMKDDEVTFEADTTGAKVPIIYSMGNHEFPLNATASDVVSASKELFTTQTGRNPAHVMKVNGYTFIVGEPQDYLLNYTAAEAFVKAQIEAAEAADPDSGKPIFYLQHQAVHGTVIESLSSASDNTEDFKTFLKNHPRVIVLSGHTHAVIEDPRSIWQDGFTAVATSQVGGGSVSGGSASFSMGTAYTGSQCIMIDMTENASENKTDVSVYRLNLLTDQVIGTPMTFTIDGTSNLTTPKNETFKYTNERYNADVSIANFKGSSSITVNSSARQGYKFTYQTTDVEVAPGDDAAYLQDNYVHAYRVVLTNTDKDIVEQNFRVFSDIYEAESDRASSYSVTLPNSLNIGTNYELSVYALTPFTTNLSVSGLNAKGVTPVTKTFATAAELTDAEKESIAENGGINVALNKTVYTAASSNSNKQNLVNGQYNDKVTPGTYSSGSQVPLPSGATVAGAANQGGDWFMIDLGRRYNLAQIKVWPSSAASDGYMMDFAVQVSNTEDFSSYVSLGSFAKDVNKTTPVIIAGDDSAYRYVRLAKTKNTYFTIGELEVFAAVKTAEDLIGPKVMNATRVNDTTISVSFTHKMDATSLQADGAVIVAQNGTPITPSGITLNGADEWDGGYDATITFANALPANGLTLTIDSSVVTTDGSTFVNDVIIPIAGKALTISKSYSKTREGVNVALNKSIIAGNTANQSGSYPVSMLVDGSTTTGFVAPLTYSADKITLPSGAKADPTSSQANDWFMIDLGRRYEVSSVVVHPVASKPAANYWGFVIEGSNDETFATSVPLGEVKQDDSTVDGTTAVTINGDGSAYRYIRLRKTANTYHLYSEIEVYANVSITDVARGKSVEVTSTSNTIATQQYTNANDGKTNTLWRLSSAAHTVPVNLVVDLGAEYPIEMAQTYWSSDYKTVYRKFDIYGASAASGKPSVDGTPASPSVKLFSTSDKGNTSDYYEFTKGSYRYVVLSKAAKTALAIAEFKAFVVNPVAYSAVANSDNTITISFTDKMETSTLVASNFSIDGVTLSDPVVSTGWDGGYDVTFTYSGTIADGMTLTVDETVRNQNGIEMAGDKALTIQASTFTIQQSGANVAAPVVGTACNITANFIPESSATVTMYVAIKTTGDVLVDCIPSEVTTVTLGELATVTVENVTLKANEKLCLFLWEDGTLKPLYESKEINAK